MEYSFFSADLLVITLKSGEMLISPKLSWKMEQLNLIFDSEIANFPAKPSRVTQRTTSTHISRREGLSQKPDIVRGMGESSVYSLPTMSQIRSSPVCHSSEWERLGAIFTVYYRALAVPFVLSMPVCSHLCTCVWRWGQGQVSSSLIAFCRVSPWNWGSLTQQSY